MTENDAYPTDAERGGGRHEDGGIIEFFDPSRATGNRPNDCTGVTCPG